MSRNTWIKVILNKSLKYGSATQHNLLWKAMDNALKELEDE